MGLGTLQVTPGYQLGPTEPLTNAIANMLAKPSVTAAITDPISAVSYWRNGNFYSTLWTTPSGVSCPVNTETGNASYWTVNPTGAAVTYKQSTTTPDLSSVFSLEIVGATSVTNVNLSQQLTPDVSGVVRGGNVTVSGWILNNTGASFVPNVLVSTCNTLSSYSSLTLRSTTPLQSCPVGVWTYVTATFSMNLTNASNGSLVSIQIPSPALSSSSYNVLFDRLQLQPGSLATPFLDDPSLFLTLPTIVNANLGAACVGFSNLDSTVTTLLPPTGSIIEFAGVTSPSGWLLCDGSAYSRTVTYSNLFNAITIQTTGNVTNGSATVSVTSTTGMGVGMPVSGPGIPAFSQIGAIGSGTITLAVIFSGVVVSGSPIVSVSSTNGLSSGMVVAGTGIAAGSTISSVGSGTITLSANCTASSVGAISLAAVVLATAPGTGVAIVVAPWGVGNGTTTFNVPDLRGRVSVGAGSGTGLTTRVQGFAFGEETHTLLTPELPVHTHVVTDPGHTHTINDPGHTHGYSDPGHTHGYISPLSTTAASGSSVFASNGVTSGNTGAKTIGITIAGNVTGVFNSASATGITNQNTGSGVTHNNCQPSVGVTKIIKI